MQVLLVVIGAAVVFAAGWFAGRLFRQSAEQVPSALPSPAATDTVDSLDSLPADVLERHSIGVCVAGRTGAIMYRNPAALALVGTHVGVLIDEAVDRHLAVALTGVPSGEVLELYGPPKRVVIVSSEPLPSNRAVAFIEDISDRHRADQARTDFVANVSHELRTPIGALMVLAETIVGERDPVVIDRIVTRMQDEADRAGNTIDHLLELSEIEAGVEREFGRVRMCDVVDDAVNRVAELAATHEITISRVGSLDSDGELGERSFVLGDRRQLASAVGNMVENAVKYSEPGDVVRVRVRCDGHEVEVAVIDEGAGIPRRDLDRVFERFYRVDRARSRATGGTGLGLSIVRHVAGNHGGSITVDSIEGEGSTFVLRLPILDAEPDATTTAADDDHANPVHGTDQREGVV